MLIPQPGDRCQTRISGRDSLAIRIGTAVVRADAYRGPLRRLPSRILTFTLESPVAAGPRPLGDVRVLAPIPSPGYTEGVIVRNARAYVATQSHAGTAGLGPSTVVAFKTRTGAIARTYTIAGENLSRDHTLTNMAFDARHRLYVLSSQLGLVRINLRTGAQDVYAPPVPDLPICSAVPLGTPCSPTATDAAPLANSLAFDAAGNAYVGDSTEATIFRIPPGGTPQVWFQDTRLDGIVGVNGLRVSPDGSRLVLAVTFTAQATGAIYSLPLVDTPQAADLALFHQYALDGGPTRSSSAVRAGSTSRWRSPTRRRSSIRGRQRERPLPGTSHERRADRQSVGRRAGRPVAADEQPRALQWNRGEHGRVRHLRRRPRGPVATAAAAIAQAQRRLTLSPRKGPSPTVRRRVGRSPAGLAGIVLLACASVATAAAQAPATRTAEATRGPRPNLIVVVADGLRVDRLQSRYMRSLHGIGSNGVVFGRAYAPAPSRTPSVASLLTSRLPSQHGAVRDTATLATSERTVAQVLRTARLCHCHHPRRRGRADRRRDARFRARHGRRAAARGETRPRRA